MKKIRIPGFFAGPDVLLIITLLRKRYLKEFPASMITKIHYRMICLTGLILPGVYPGTND